MTNSERRVQRVRAALKPPGRARADIEIMCDLARRLGRSFSYDSPEDVWNELRTLAPNHAGMGYARLEALGGIQWPCWDEDTLHNARPLATIAEHPGAPAVWTAPGLALTA